MNKVLFYVSQMLIDRGCVIDPPQVIQDTSKDLKLIEVSSCNDSNNSLKPCFENGPYPYLNNSCVERYSEGAKIYIARYFMKENLEVKSFDLSKSDLKQILDETLKHIVSKAPPKMDIIIIIPDAIFNKVSIEDKLTDRICLFSERDFKFNPTKNMLTPRHIRASQEDIQKLRLKKIKNEHLPKILESDPICKWYGFRKEEIIKIYRNYCETIYYRIVSN